MASITNAATGAGYPYPCTFTFEYNAEARDNNRHVISWNVKATGGANNYYQYYWNGQAQYKGSWEGDSGWRSVWGSAASGSAWNGQQLGSGSFEWWHTDAVTLNMRIGGGYGSSSAYNEKWGDLYLAALYTAPSSPSVSNQTSNGDYNKAYAKIQTSNWGTNSSRSKYVVYQGNTNKGESTSDPGYVYWTPTNVSTNTASCAVNSWFGRAINNHALQADSGAVYLATPTAPTFTLTAGSGTSPSTTAAIAIKYKGGSQNSTSCDNGTMKRFRVGVMTSSQSTPSSLTNKDTTSKSVTQTWSSNSFAAGTNYKLYAQAINTYGGSSYAASQIIYCPQGVSGLVSSRTPTSITIKAKANSAGTVNASSGGTLSCYKLQWGTSSSSLNNTIGAQTSDTFTISGLTPNQTIYYKITAWNVYGLNNVSTVTSATSLPRYNPEFTITDTENGGEYTIDFTLAFTQTGGTSPTELPVTTLTIDKRPAGGTWTNVTTITGLNITTDDSYTASVTIGIQPTAGDYEFRITASNGTDSASQTKTVQGPSNLTLSTSIPTNEFIQIKGTATVTPGEVDRAAILPQTWILTNETLSKTYELTSTSASVNILTDKHNDFDTSYTFRMKCIDSNGLWTQSMQSTITTKKRFNFYGVRGETIKVGNEVVARNGQEIPITEVYFIRKNALGNVTVGDSLRKHTLEFITQPLHYRPESVASITLSDGKQIKYGHDETSGVCVFGIWASDEPETIFFDDENGWTMTDYTFPDSDLTVTAISAHSHGLNASAPFSTTVSRVKADWEA